MTSNQQSQQNSSQQIQTTSKYQQKLTILHNQSNQFSTKLQYLKNILQKNEEIIIKQNICINQLSERIVDIQNRTDAKLLVLSKELQNFKGYYEQTYCYTVTRVRQIQQTTRNFIRIVEEEIAKLMGIPAVEYVKYAYELIANIVKGCALKGQQIKQYVNQQLFQLELEVGNFKQYASNIQQIVDQFKNIKYGNQSLKQSIESSKQILLKLNNSQNLQTNSQTSKRVITFYQPKFREILKRINGYSMEIQLVKLLINSNNNQAQLQLQAKRKQQINQLQNKIKELEDMLQDQKKQHQKHINKKDQILKKRHDKILELEQSKQSLLDKQVKMQNQINQLKIINGEYVKENKILSIKKQKLVNQENQKIKRTQIEGKLLILQIQHENLQKRYYAQQAQLNNLKKSMKSSDAQLSVKLSKSQKFLNFQQSNQRKQRSVNKSKASNNPNPKTSTQTSDTVKSMANINKNSDLDYIEMLKENDKLIKNNKQLQKINKQLQEQIHRLIIDKKKQNQQDQLYLDRVQAEIQKNHIQIEGLESTNLELSNKNHELEALNQKLKEDLQDQIENYQNLSKNFKNIVYQLQKKIELLTNKNQKLELKLLQYQPCIKSTISRKTIYDSSSPPSSKASVISGTNQNQFQDSIGVKNKQKKANKYIDFLVQLQNAIKSMNLSIPIHCDIDKHGFIRQKKTGHYLVDQYKKPMRLNEGEINSALESGLFLI